MKTLYRLPYIRHGILIYLFEWLVKNIRTCHIEVMMATPNDLKRLTKNQGYMIDRGQGLPGKLEIMDFVIHCIGFFKQIIEECSKFSNSACLEVLKTLSRDSIYKHLLVKINRENDETLIKSDRSLLDQIIEVLTTFTKTAKEKPEIISKSYNFTDNQDSWIEDITSPISEVILCLSKVYENYHSSLKEEEKQKSEYEIS